MSGVSRQYIDAHKFILVLANNLLPCVAASVAAPSCVQLHTTVNIFLVHIFCITIPTISNVYFAKIIYPIIRYLVGFRIRTVLNLLIIVCVNTKVRYRKK